MSLNLDLTAVARQLQKETDETRTRLYSLIQAELRDFHSRTGLLITGIDIRMVSHVQRTVEGSRVSDVIINSVDLTTNATDLF